MANVRIPFDLIDPWRWGAPGYVYFLQPVGGGAVKIGTSGDLLTRFVELSVGSPTPLHYALVLPGSPALEKWMHRRFAATRSHGEWFSDAETVLTYGHAIAKVIRQHPGPTVYEALLAGLRAVDDELAAMERLWHNGVTYDGICELTGLEKSDAQSIIRLMRHIGFDIAWRRSRRGGKYTGPVARGGRAVLFG